MPRPVSLVRKHWSGTAFSHPSAYKHANLTNIISVWTVELLGLCCISHYNWQLFSQLAKQMNRFIKEENWKNKFHHMEIWITTKIKILELWIPRTCQCCLGYKSKYFSYFLYLPSWWNGSWQTLCWDSWLIVKEQYKVKEIRNPGSFPSG